MKKFNLLSFLVVGALLMSATFAKAQGRYEVRLVPGSYNCAKDSVTMCVEIRSTSADSAFVMGNANILLTYPTNQLSNPVYRSRGVFSGGTYSLLGMTRTPGDPTSALSINIVNNGVNGEGTTVDTNWKTVACLAFSTAGNTSKCYSISVSSSNPSTVVTMAYPDPADPQNNMSLTRQVSQGALTPITNQCPATPTVLLSGGGTIPAGGSSTLTVASQNSVLPATVALNGGISVTLTQQEPSKTVTVTPTNTTTYTVQSVTGSCGAGTGQGTATVTIQSTGTDCSNVKCVPITFRIIN
ncbi:hypothetical protein FHS57_002796 [Runella defluvii]|uniref:Uncharacterized protein n=1 Tax=Runella defluvii TaxID=370973 RepID=A0A7W5ZKE9_9BACT|nr:hypothetical protein [Runella defluvii]MBB3838790.1 hypothetical protein [Runella defluvii]